MTTIQSISIQSVGPIVLDVSVLVCALFAAKWDIIDHEFFKYILGSLAVGNIALRIPRRVGASGGGIVVAIVSMFSYRGGA